MIVAATIHKSSRTKAIDDMASCSGRSTSVFTSLFAIVFSPCGHGRGRRRVQERGRHRLAEGAHRLGVRQGDVHDRQAGVEALTRDRADHTERRAAHREAVAEAGDREGVVDHGVPRTTEVVTPSQPAASRAVLARRPRR